MTDPKSIAEHNYRVMCQVVHRINGWIQYGTKRELSLYLATCWQGTFLRNHAPDLQALGYKVTFDGDRLTIKK